MSLPLIIADDEPICNSDGCIRLAKVRDFFGLTFDPSNIDLIVGAYTTWRDTVEIMPFRDTYKTSKYINLNDTASDAKTWINYYNNEFPGLIATRFNEASELVCYEGFERKWNFYKSRKRGNDVYIHEVKKQFNDLIKSDKLPKAWKTEYNSKRKRIRKSKLLYVTGTVSHKSCGNCNLPLSFNDGKCKSCGSKVFIKHPISDRWIEFGRYWNSFITNIREQFGGCEYLRVWQSQENGYPHFHAIIYFPHYWFSAVKNKEYNHRKKKWEYVWRVHNRQKKNGKYIRDIFRSAWSHGFIDVKVCDDTKEALKDLKKYVTRDLEGGESDLTNAMVWFYRKRAFSFSKGFMKTFGKSIAEPSDADLINASGVIQRSNSKKKLVCREIFPLVKRDDVDFFYNKKIDDIDNVPDPPPAAIEYFEKLADKCEASKVIHHAYDDGSTFTVIVYKKKSEGW